MNRKVFIDIREVVRAEEILAMLNIKKRGANVSCPLHSDKNPSCQINDKGFYCHSCGEHGDMIHFVAIHEGISELQSAMRIARYFGLDIDWESNVLPPVNRHKVLKDDYVTWWKSALNLLAWWSTEYIDVIRGRPSVDDIENIVIEQTCVERLHEEILNMEPEDAYNKYKDEVEKYAKRLDRRNKYANVIRRGGSEEDVYRVLGYSEAIRESA